MADDYKIPAASISDVDLAAIAEQNPAAAKKIARLGELMECGNETKEDFRMASDQGLRNRLRAFPARVQSG